MLAIIMKGLPWSGKSTRASQQTWYTIISKDMIRKADPLANEELVHTRMLNDIAMSSELWVSIIIDNTHMNKWTLQSTIDLCKKLWYDVKVKDMFVEWFQEERHNAKYYLDECIKRNAQREQPVPESVIHNMYLKNYEIKDAYFIFDIDGTLARMHPERREALDRKDYRAFYSDLVLKDEPIEEVQRILYRLYKFWYWIVLMSWRSNECCKQTVERLDKYVFPYDHLLMRQAWNHNQDSYVKSRLFDECLWRQDAKCLWVFDDREQVMKMWRDKWLFVFDVSQGNRDF